PRRRTRRGADFPRPPAEGLGFEPRETRKPQRFSRPPPSTARPPLRSNNDRPLVSFRREPTGSQSRFPIGGSSKARDLLPFMLARWPDRHDSGRRLAVGGPAL